jgi:hypothetical protein
MRGRVGAERMHGIEPLPAGLEQDADQVDDDIGVPRRRLDRGRVAQIGRHRMDLVDPSERLQVAAQIRPADRNPGSIGARNRGWSIGPTGRLRRRDLTSGIELPYVSAHQAQVAELVDALVSGTSGESRGGSSPLLGTKLISLIFANLQLRLGF